MEGVGWRIGEKKRDTVVVIMIAWSVLRNLGDSDEADDDERLT